MATEHPAGPTPYADVNVLLRELLAGVRAIVGDQLVGMYLYGSLSLGDFDLLSSDVDFLVVTAGELPPALLERLRQMHAEIAASDLPYATRLEGSYIPCMAWRRYDPANARHPTVGKDWPFQVAEHGPNWILERAIVREHGVVVYGPPPETLIEPIMPDALRAAVCEQMLGTWQARANDDEWLRPRAYQAFTVLTFGRALYTLKHGTVASKPQAAAWAMATYPAWRPSIEQALVWRADHSDGDPAETMAFLREALALVWRHCEDCAS